MATTITCGTTGRNWSTLQAAVDAIPATPTGGYIVDCYNDSEFTAAVTIDGHTTSAANFIRLTAAAGQSFQDHANVRTNPLFYDQTKGVGVSVSTNVQVIFVSDDWTEVRRLQIKRTGFGAYGEGALNFDPGLGNSFAKDCLVQKTYSSIDTIVKLRQSSAINCIAIETGGDVSTGFSMFVSGPVPKVLNCTAVRSSALGAGGVGFGASAGYPNSVAINCASFGWTTAFSAAGGWDLGASGYNCSDQADPPGSNDQASKTFANQFESTTNDFRIKTGSDCIDHGNTDATLAPNDISGLARGVGTAGDIGVWEIAGAPWPPPGSDNAPEKLRVIQSNLRW